MVIYGEKVSMWKENVAICTRSYSVSRPKVAKSVC